MATKQAVQSLPATVAPPPSLRTPALRMLNPAAHIPDDAGLISYGRYEVEIRASVTRLQAQGVPIRLEEIETKEGSPPILHVWAGDGPNHHLSLSAVHSNETLSYLVDLAEMESAGRNPHVLRQLGITWHWLHLDPEGTRLSEKGLIGQPDPHRYASGMHRTLVARKQLAWGLPGTAGERSFYGPLIPGVRAFMRVVNPIYANGEQIISIRHGHNSHLDQTGASFYLPTHVQQLGKSFEAAAEARGLTLMDTPPESDLQEKVPETKATFTAFPAEQIFAGGGGNDPERYIAEVAKRHGKPAPASAVFEPVKWGPEESNPALQNLTLQRAERMTAETLGAIPRLTAQAKLLLETYTKNNPAALNNPLVEGAISAAKWDLRLDASNNQADTPAEPRTLSEAEAFSMTVTLPFYRAARVGQIVRGLEQCGLDVRLQKDLRAQMHRVINEIFTRGKLKPVSTATAARAMADVGLLTLEHGLAVCRQHP